MRRKMTPTGNLTREEWLQLRRNGIGGSDASVYGKESLQKYFTAVGRKNRKAASFQIMEMNLLTGGM